MSVIDTLVTDRTLEDVQRVQLLTTKKVLSSTEQVEWYAGMKGAYNYSDLNRVESAVQYIASALQEADVNLRAYATNLQVEWQSAFEVPYDPTAYDLNIKTDWVYDDSNLNTSEMTRYLSNATYIIGAIQAEYPQLPQSMHSLNYTGANNIERALIVLYNALLEEYERLHQLIYNTSQAWYYTGDVYAGEVEA